MARRHPLTSLAALAAWILLATAGAADYPIIDEFEEDPIDAGGDWELYNPTNVDFAHETDGQWWRFVFPIGVNLDHWSGADRAIQLRRGDIPEDFVIETRLNFVGSGTTPDDATWPPVNEAYHAALMVYFSRYDTFYWGPYRGSLLRLERSGQNNLCNFDPGLQEVSLQIKKSGTTYSFSWRAEDTDDWTLVCTRTATERPILVGFNFKTWANMTRYHVFEYDYFKIDELVEPPEIEEIAPDPYPAFAGSPFRLPMRLVLGTASTWSLLQGPPGATIDPATGEIEWTPAAEDLGKRFAFEVKAENAAGSDTEAFEVIVRELFCDPFDDEPDRLGSEWELYNPLNAIFENWIEDGWWHVIVPAGVNLDHWSRLDRGIQLRTAGMPSDFAIETRIRFLGSGDPDDPTWPPVNESYQAGLMVYFSQYHTFYWGPYRGTNLRVERSGLNNLCNFDPGLQEVSLQIKKEGSEYSFSWRADDADHWSLVCTLTLDEATYPPRMVGLIFKTWAPTIAQNEIFEFDYFCIKAIECDPPWIAPMCPADPDLAWVGMPYIRPLDVGGCAPLDFRVASGPPLAYDSTARVLSGWTPEREETIALSLKATNAAGSADAGWTIRVSDPPVAHDDEFDDDPTQNIDFWEFYEPQTGIVYDIVQEDGTSWWRMEVPPLGDSGLNFDHWTTLDRAIQLRHALDDPDADFLIETRIRVDPEAAPPPDDEFHVGLMLYFGQYDIIYFGAMEERTIGGRLCNVSVERSGTQNVLGGTAPGLLQGSPIGLRIEKKCGWYNFFFRDEGEGTTWTHAGTYRTASVPLYVGLVMKTWGDGLAHNAIFDFDYFDIVEPGGEVPVEIFRRGDVDGNGLITIGDAIVLLNHMFAGFPEPECPDAGDVDDDGIYTIGDAISLLNYQFAGGPPPRAPGPTSCGPDPTPDRFGPCQYNKALCK